MAEAQISPIVVQLPTSPHSLDLERAPARLPSPASLMPQAGDQSSASTAEEADQQDQNAQIEPDPDPDTHADTPMPEAPAPQPENEAAPEVNVESEGTQLSSEADTPYSVVAPVEETAMESTDNTTTVAPNPPVEESSNPTPPEALQTRSTEEGSAPRTELGPPPPPEWVMWEEDTSVPTAEEIKEFEGTDANLSALDVAAYEKKLFREWTDPEQRPVKKIRLSWVIKGVRGTKERPNMARTMHSPAALVDGLYWQIKLYPRGNKTESLSAYIRCSLSKPSPDTNLAESTFAYFEGPPDGNVGEGAEPKEVVKTEPTPSDVEDKNDDESQSPETSDKTAESENAVEQSLPTTSQGVQQSAAENVSDSQPEADTAMDVKTDTETKDENQTSSDEKNDFRIATQLGMVIYNPQEPRTAMCMSSEHQFNPYNDDWGWTSFVGPWREIHKRQPGQFQALLRNDSLAIDAYILIFDDPTQALWWHESADHETVWPSKRLAGYYPMGTETLYHSPAVAGLTSWLLLAPFRHILQAVDTGKWRHDSQIRPKPLIATLQQVLHAMRHLIHFNYVEVSYCIEELRDAGEEYHDVLSFWEVLRRSVELELAEDCQALSAISDIFDTKGHSVKVPALPVKGVENIQQALHKVAIPPPMQELGPKFLPLALKRDTFDPVKREWKLQHDRVCLNEEVVLPGSGEKYTLYGFVVHVGQRNSGRFYCIVRPNGPGTKWLAFEDGDGNKVFSYTRHRLREFEGLEASALANFRGTRSTAYLAMYIKTSCLTDFLPGELEDYKAPAWIDQDSETGSSSDESAKKEAMIDVEVYHDDSIIGRAGLVNKFNMKSQVQGSSSFKKYTFPRSMKFYAVRRKLAENLGLDNPQKLRMFTVGNGIDAEFTNPKLKTLRLKHTIGRELTLLRPLCLWCSTLKTDADVEAFGYPDRDNTKATTRAETEIATELWESSDDDVEDAVAEGANTNASPEPTGDNNNNETQPVADVVMSEDRNTPAEPGTAIASLPDQQASQLGTEAAGNLNVEANEQAIPPSDEVTTAPALVTANEATVESSRDASPQHQHAPEANTDSMTDIPPIQIEVVPETDESAAVRPVAVARKPPVENLYGFLQLFQADKQDFVIHSTFFVKREEPVKDAIRRHLGYDTEKAFHVWHRDGSLSGSPVNDKATFYEIDFYDGGVIVVGDILEEEKVASFRQQGKFKDPFELSRHMHLCERRHPIHQSLATADPVEISDFGGEYFHGPLLNGQPHGPNCTKITAQGHTYTGPMVMSQKSGDYGKMIYQNGDTYEGGWLNDERHGDGTLVQNRTGNKYVGGFMNDKRWGKGTTHWEMADEEASMCQICYGSDIDALFYNCGHVCACSDCAKQCNVCPICRKEVKEVVRMFWA